ncbi:MAG: hypothetical protein WB562_03780, partial [Candidatus Sulfotelmatobacter sp.]
LRPALVQATTIAARPADDARLLRRRGLQGRLKFASVRFWCEIDFLFEFRTCGSSLACSAHRRDRLRGWGDRTRTLMCREKIHLFDKSPELGFA